MEWHLLNSQLNRELARFPADPLALPVIPPQQGTEETAFALLQELTGEACDQACLAYIATGRWPTLSPPARWMLHWRLRFAADLAYVLAEGCLQTKWFPTHDLPTGKQLEWLLVEAWAFPGENQTKEWFDLIDSIHRKHSAPELKAAGHQCLAGGM